MHHCHPKLYLVLLTCSLAACNGGRWTEAQRQDFEKKCTQTDTVSNLTVVLEGFSREEIQHCIMRRIHNGKVADSFTVVTDHASSDLRRSQYFVTLSKTLYTKDAYEFAIAHYKPFVLSEMKMVMWAQFTMFSEGYGCVMGDYKLDGKPFEHDANPVFVKPGFRQ